ncbi:hypothetical protein BDR26DRAFT_235684 [Obelidium mucronatum]|nr:hypothetical protein BDR26DRAFT_235684 [Obelidium mucronatum]
MSASPPSDPRATGATREEERNLFFPISNRLSPCSPSSNVKQRKSASVSGQYIDFPDHINVSVPPRAPMRDNKEFHKIYPDIHISERLIEVYSCADFRREVPLAGRLWVSSRHVCFSSVFTSSITIEIRTITSIQKKSTIVIVPNAIQIEAASGSYFFASFFDRDSTYSILMQLWELNIQLPERSFNNRARWLPSSMSATNAIEPDLVRKSSLTSLQSFNVLPTQSKTELCSPAISSDTLYMESTHPSYISIESNTCFHSHDLSGTKIFCGNLTLSVAFVGDFLCNFQKKAIRRQSTLRNCVGNLMFLLIDYSRGCEFLLSRWTQPNSVKSLETLESFSQTPIPSVWEMSAGSSRIVEYIAKKDGKRSRCRVNICQEILEIVPNRFLCLKTSKRAQDFFGDEYTCTVVTCLVQSGPEMSQLTASALMEFETQSMDNPKIAKNTMECLKISFLNLSSQIYATFATSSDQQETDEGTRREETIWPSLAATASLQRPGNHKKNLSTASSMSVMSVSTVRASQKKYPKTGRRFLA